MISVLGIMVVGMIFGYFFRKKEKLMAISSYMTKIIIIVLVFILGVGVGLNDKIMSSLDTIGLQSVVITFGALLGSLIFAYITYQCFFVSHPKSGQ